MCWRHLVASLRPRPTHTPPPPWINRNTTWLQLANLLFVDNPVGTGFSYVDDTRTQLTTNNTQIANDLVTLFVNLTAQVP